MNWLDTTYQAATGILKTMQRSGEQAERVGKSMAFSFGDPEPVLSKNPVDYLGLFMDSGDKYYEPPISQKGLASLMGANAYHGPIINFKKNMVMKWFQPSALLSMQDMRFFTYNYLALGNGYLQHLVNPFGTTTKLAPLASIPMRRGKDPSRFFMIGENYDDIEFKENEIIQLAQTDLNQQIYGIPEWFGGIQSVLLSEESTLFRRKYYINGAHMGYILVTNDAGIKDQDAKEIEKQIKQSKGPGNFRSLYLNIGRSQAKEPVQIIPIGDIGTKDEFVKIKDVTEREMLAMHRMPPGLSGIIPQNTSGFGDLEKLMHVYYELEIIPLQKEFLTINEIMGAEVIKFSQPEWLNG